jgi:hypothetical protein
MNFFKALARYFELSNFWNERVDFYRDLARAIDEKELLRDFVVGELEISLAPKTADRDRAVGLMFMSKLMAAGINEIHEVLLLAMPASDAMGLSVLRDSKNKAEALRFVANNVEQQKAMTATVTSALASPLLLVPVGLAFAYILATQTIPAFEQAAPPEIWYGFSQFVRASSHFVKDFGLMLVLTIAAFLVWFVLWALPNLTSIWRMNTENATGKARWLSYLLGPVQPMLSLYRDIQSARMLANLATLLQAGRSLQDALLSLMENATPWMRKHLGAVHHHLQMLPGDYVGAFSHGVLSATLLSRLHTKVRRDSGLGFSQILIEIGTDGQERAREGVQKYASRANRILLVFTISIVLFFYGGQVWVQMQIQDANTPLKIMERANARKLQATKSISD